ncbi:hypothetical protein [Citrobacter freundii]|uniref:Uncharacterized protein n=1 Tax=Citrobacter freundii TaxID=546 RepID=A0A7G2IK66_CITFR|nr:hypothetical protein [Citrobacter freundii]
MRICRTLIIRVDFIDGVFLTQELFIINRYPFVILCPE